MMRNAPALPRFSPRNSLIRRFPNRFPLWLVLNVPFALILLVSAGLIGYLGLQSGVSTASDLADQLLMESAAHIQQNLDSFFDTASLLNEQNLAAIRLKQLNLSDPLALERQFFAQMQSYKTIKAIAYGTQQGEFFATFRDLLGADFVFGEASARTNFSLQGYTANSQGERAQPLTSIPDYDPRPRTWYQAAMKAGQSTWTPIYTWVDQLGIAVDVASPVYNDGGKLLGVFDVSLDPSAISAFLHNLSASNKQSIFIVDDAGLPVASSTMPQPYTSTNGALQRLNTLTISDPFIQSVSKQAAQQFGGWSAINSSQLFEFAQADEKSLAQVTPYQGVGSRWWIVTTIPEATYMASIDQHVRQTLLLIGASLIVFVGLLTLVARRITHPILQLSQAAKAFAAGSWSERVVVKRRDEIGELAASFNQMADQLQHSTLSLQASEARLRAIFENSAEAILVINKGGIVTSNPACQAMFGFSNSEELNNKAVQDFIAPDERPRIEGYFRSRLVAEVVPPMYETRGLRQDGSEFFMEVRVSTFIQNGEVYALRCCATSPNVSKRRKRFRRVKRASGAI